MLSREALAKVFERLDRDGSGSISASELARTQWSEEATTLTEQELRRLLSEAGFSAESELGFEDFVQFYEVASLYGVFKSMDGDESGHVSATEIKSAFLRQGVRLTDDQLRDMLRDVDKDDDGLLTFGEFRACFGNMPLSSMRQLADRWAALSQVQLGSDLGMPSVPPDSVPLWRFVLAGGLGGAVGRVLLAPLERVQIMAQSGNLPSGKGPLAAARHIAAHEGVGALWRGVTPSLLKVFPFAGTVCLVYSQLLAASPADSELDPMEPVWRFAAGGVAGAVATTTTYPLDLVRARMAVSGSPGSEVVAPGRPRLSLVATASSVVRQQGLGGLFRGFRPTLYAMVPFIAIQQSSYDVIKAAAERSLEPSVPLYAACGLTAGLLAQTAVYPLEVIRRRVQTSSLEETGRAGTGFMLRSLRTLRAQGGAHALFAGLSTTYLKVMPNVAIGLVVRDAVLGRLSKGPT